MREVRGKKRGRERGREGRREARRKEGRGEGRRESVLGFATPKYQPITLVPFLLRSLFLKEYCAHIPHFLLSTSSLASGILLSESKALLNLLSQRLTNDFPMQNSYSFHPLPHSFLLNKLLMDFFHGPRLTSIIFYLP